MFREMRRKKQQLSQMECERILSENSAATLACIGDEGYPYSVPLSYVYSGGKIYFHSAVQGHKIDAIRNDSKVCVSIIDKDDVVPEKYTTYFKSVVAFGNARILTDDEEIKKALVCLADKYECDTESKVETEIKRFFDKVLIIEVDICHMTGKQAIELVNNK